VSKPGNARSTSRKEREWLVGCDASGRCRNLGADDVKGVVVCAEVWWCVLRCGGVC